MLDLKEGKIRSKGISQKASLAGGNGDNTAVSLELQSGSI